MQLHTIAFTATAVTLALSSSTLAMPTSSYSVGAYQAVAPQGYGTPSLAPQAVQTPEPQAQYQNAAIVQPMDATQTQDVTQTPDATSGYGTPLYATRPPPAQMPAKVLAESVNLNNVDYLKQLLSQVPQDYLQKGLALVNQYLQGTPQAVTADQQEPVYPNAGYNAVQPPAVQPQAINAPQTQDPCDNSQAPATVQGEQITDSPVPAAVTDAPCDEPAAVSSQNTTDCNEAPAAVQGEQITDSPVPAAVTDAPCDEPSAVSSQNTTDCNEAPAAVQGEQITDSPVPAAVNAPCDEPAAVNSQQTTDCNEAPAAVKDEQINDCDDTPVAAPATVASAAFNETGVYDYPQAVKSNTGYGTPQAILPPAGKQTANSASAALSGALANLSNSASRTAGSPWVLSLTLAVTVLLQVL